MWWLFRTVPNHLPKPTGPYQVSCVDIFTEHSPDGILLRLYYPTMPAEQYVPDYKKWIPWLPCTKYVDGFAKLWAISLWIVRLVLWITGNIRVPIEYGNPIMKKDKYKCVVFSHGLGGARFCYSAILTDMASRGFLVAAVEHRDESSAHTYYYEDEESAKGDRRMCVDFKHVEIGWHHELRFSQVQQRSEECSQVLDFLMGAERGETPKCRLQPYFADKSQPIDFKIDDLKGHLDLNDLTIMGHSFGAATSLLTLSKRKEFKHGVILDPWMFPLKSLPELSKQVPQPLIFINTHTFHIDVNIKVMEKFYVENPPNMYTMLQTTHENQADGVFVAGSWLNWFMKKIDPVTALTINNALIYKFLNETIKYPPDISDSVEYLNIKAESVYAGIPKPWPVKMKLRS